MLFIFALVASVLISIIQIVSPSRGHALCLKKFTYGKQRLVSILYNVPFVITILIVGICTDYEGVCGLLFIIQLCINAVFISVLDLVGTNKFRQHVIDEILRLNIDITEDTIVIRRKLMENSEISCSIKDIQLAIDAIEKGRKSN